MDQYNKRLFSVTGAQTQSLRFIYSNKDVEVSAFQTSKNQCLSIACYLGFQMNINARFKCISVLKAVVKYLYISFEILLLLCTLCKGLYTSLPIYVFLSLPLCQMSDGLLQKLKGILRMLFPVAFISPGALASLKLHQQCFIN